MSSQVQDLRTVQNNYLVYQRKYVVSGFCLSPLIGRDRQNIIEKSSYKP
ncbi:hypothetical protein GXM_08106 [Nostoc sphaeroides CCNUC1]|uniref:Uncharacterized protein n=1 Tax=Nostoc sphaeroides CCNUC1 TaxID=2653204 RepID=A0A5P8WDI6_9NOSO|nr:hypothetical protein GXM_08106 [Nostoc sphaeroides CCNUC1]